MATNDDVENYEPRPRYFHVAGVVAGPLYVWGGWTHGEVIDSTRIEQFDPVQKLWRQHHSTGPPHPGLVGAVSVAVDNDLFMYGGSFYDNDGELFCGVLSKLSISTHDSSFEWTSVHAVVQGNEGGVMRKRGHGLVQINNGKQLAMFGGYGIPTGPTQPGAQFIIDDNFPNGRGWSNELHICDTNAGSHNHNFIYINIILCTPAGVWFSPTLTETSSRPRPCADFTLTSFDVNRAVLFAGKQPENAVVNDVYIFDFRGPAVVC